MTDDEKAATFAPNAMARYRTKRAELDARVEAGAMTRAEAIAELQEFGLRSIAHVREHGEEKA